MRTTRAATTDPTAGKTARAVELDPGAPARVVDPTDPRNGHAPVEPAPRVLDPTDPAHGETPA